MQGLGRHLPRNKTVGTYLRVVTHALEETVGNARRPTRAPGNLSGAGLVNADLQQLGGAADDGLQLFLRIEVEADDHAKTVPQGRGQQASARRGSHQGKAWQGEFNRAGTGPLADDNV